MTREEAKKTLQDMWECLFNEMTNHTFEDLKEHGILDNYSTAFNMALSALSKNIEDVKEPTLLESFKDSTGKVTEIWAVKGKLQIRTRGIIHNCNGIFGNDISVKSVNGSIAVFPDSENKGDLISRQAVKKQIEEWAYGREFEYSNATHYINKRIDSIPSANNEGKSKMGHWICHKEEFNALGVAVKGGVKCSECGYTTHNKLHMEIGCPFKFCPNCGADMRGSTDE